MTEVLITGVGVVSPLGIGVEPVRDALRDRRSGVRRLDTLAATGWPHPIGADVADFDPKRYVQPRKSLKVMAREIQLAFAAGELAWADAGLDGIEVDAERVGVVGAAGLMYCALDELADPIHASLSDDRSTNDEGWEGHTLDLRKWGADGMSRLFPLWLLKYLPNLAACHVGIRRDALGPTNTVSLGDVSSLTALGEATETIRRGAADVMLVGGAGSRLDMTDLVFRGGLGQSKRGGDPATVCRPFDAERDGFVAAEGAAYFVLESREHAERRGFAPRGGRAWGTVRSVQSRCEAAMETRQPTGDALRRALAAALRSADVSPSDLAMVKAHGAAMPVEDAIEAAALREVIEDAPVTAPTSYVGTSGAACGAVELALALVAWRDGVVPATLNYQTPDPACPVNASPEHRPAAGPAIAAINYARTGQAVAAVIGGPEAE